MSAHCNGTVAYGTYVFATLLIYTICCRRPADIDTLPLLSRIQSTSSAVELLPSSRY